MFYMLNETGGGGGGKESGVEEGVQAAGIWRTFRDCRPAAFRFFFVLLLLSSCCCVSQCIPHMLPPSCFSKQIWMHFAPNLTRVGNERSAMR